MNNIAFTILLLIMIALIVNDALCVKQIRDLTRELRSYKNTGAEESQGIKTKSKAQDRILVELAHAVNTLSAQEALLNNKVSRAHMAIDRLKKDIRDLEDPNNADV